VGADVDSDDVVDDVVAGVGEQALNPKATAMTPTRIPRFTVSRIVVRAVLGESGPLVVQ